MQLTSLILLLGLSATTLANPMPEPAADLESRNLIPILCGGWDCSQSVCQKWKPSCSIGWNPKYCSKGWGDKGCVDWCKLFFFFVLFYEGAMADACFR